MDETLFKSLSLSEKADYVKKHAEFVEAQDFYSFFVLIYLLNQQEYKLYYDFSGLLISVESEEETSREGFLAHGLANSLDTDNI